MRARNIEEERELTARPKTMLEEIGADQPEEDGLSVDPEDMGRSFLRNATEQDNFESSQGIARELSLNGAGRGDEALPGPHLSSEGSIWENTVDMTLEAESMDGITDDVTAADDSSEAESPRGVAEIDLTENAINDGSLLDSESDVLGEVIESVPNTDDQGQHAKRKAKR